MRRLSIFLFLAFNISAYGQTPSKAASNITFTNVGCNEITVSWTPGNGNERVVFIREGSAFTKVPQQNDYYSPANALDPWKSESMENNPGVPFDHFCVFRGTFLNSITIKKLKGLTTYYIAIFEFNGSGGSYDYLTSSYPTDYIKTKGITADFSMDSLSQCLNGNKVQFTNNSSTTQSPGTMTYKWDFGDSVPSTAQDPRHSFKYMGPKSVKLIAYGIGCTDTIKKTTDINPHPVPVFVLDSLKAKNDSIQCFYGNRFTFLNKTTLGGWGSGQSSTRYEWYVNDTALFSSAYKADKAFNASGVFKVKMIAISNKGCKDSTYKYYKVLPRAIDRNKVIIDPKSKCLSDALFTFTNNSPLSISSRWHFGDGGADSLDGSPVDHRYLKVGKYYITLQAYDANGCLDVMKKIDSVDVISNTKVSFKNLLPTYCLNDYLTKLTPTPGGGLFFGTNVNPADSSFTPASVGKFKVGYVYSVGNCRDTAWDSTFVFKRPNVYIGNDTVICFGQPITLNVDPKYNSMWTPGSVSGSSYQVNSSGNFTVISEENGCKDTATINVKVIAAPKISHTPDTTLCGGSYLKFNLKADLGTALWSDGSNLKDRNLTTTGFYKIVLSNKCGTVSDSFNLTVEETACIVFFPNAFTPNADLLNDTWQPFGKYEFIRMNIFNRWGERVYFSDKSPVWNGTHNDKELCLDGVYNIVFEYQKQDGNTMKNEVKGIVVHLIR